MKKLFIFFGAVSSIAVNDTCDLTTSPVPQGTGCFSIVKIPGVARDITTTEADQGVGEDWAFIIADEMVEGGYSVKKTKLADVRQGNWEPATNFSFGANFVKDNLFTDNMGNLMFFSKPSLFLKGVDIPDVNANRMFKGVLKLNITDGQKIYCTPFHNIGRPDSGAGNAIMEYTLNSSGAVTESQKFNYGAIDLTYFNGNKYILKSNGNVESYANDGILPIKGRAIGSNKNSVFILSNELALNKEGYKVFIHNPNTSVNTEIPDVSAEEICPLHNGGLLYTNFKREIFLLEGSFWVTKAATIPSSSPNERRVAIDFNTPIDQQSLEINKSIILSPPTLSNVRYELQNYNTRLLVIYEVNGYTPVTIMILGSGDNPLKNTSGKPLDGDMDYNCGGDYKVYIDLDN